MNLKDRKNNPAIGEKNDVIFYPSLIGGWQTNRRKA